MSKGKEGENGVRGDWEGRDEWKRTKDEKREGIYQRGTLFLNFYVWKNGTETEQMERGAHLKVNSSAGFLFIIFLSRDRTDGERCDGEACMDGKERWGVCVFLSYMIILITIPDSLPVTNLP